jgi:hypothetical protein
VQEGNTMRSLTVPVLTVALISAAGCGGSSSDKTTALSTATTQVVDAGGAPPAELLRSYTTTLTKADTKAEASKDLRDQYPWKLTITKDGGVNNSPTVTMTAPPSNVLESSTVAVSGNTLALTGEECAQASGGYTTVTSTYTWKLDGKTLHLTTAEPGCPDKVAQTILTSEPWKKS